VDLHNINLRLVINKPDPAYSPIKACMGYALWATA